MQNGKKIRITISDDGAVVVEGALLVNAIFPFATTSFPNEGHVFGGIAANHDDYLAVLSRVVGGGIEAEVDRKQAGAHGWWGILDRPAIRLDKTGAGKGSFRFAFRNPKGTGFFQNLASLPLRRRAGKKK